jgi:hypothetical protein
MKLMSLLGKILSPEPDDQQHGAADAADSPPDPREQLRAAHRGLEEAKQLQTQRAAESERVRQLIVAAGTADEELRAAEAQAIEATRQWAVAGAQGELPADAQARVEAAEAARRRAYAARLLARGAEAALDEKLQALPSEVDAKQAVEQARGVIGRATLAILHETATPGVRRALELWDELRLLLPSLMGLAYLRKFNLSLYPYAGAPPPELSDLVATLQPAFHFSHEDLIQLMAPWTEFGHRLTSDPEAQPDRERESTC